MSNLSVETPHCLGKMDRVFERLGALMGQIGLDISVWDLQGGLVGSWQSDCEFARMIAQVDSDLEGVSPRLAESVVAGNSPASARAETGHCLIAVPVRHRRRILGAVLASFPPKQMLEEEFLARLCDKLKLDREVVRTQGQASSLHDAEQADALLKTLTWTLENLQARAIADEELLTFSNNLASTYEELALLYRVSGSMRVTQQPDQFLQEVCDDLLDVMNIGASVAVVYAHPPAVEEDIVAVAGQFGMSTVQIKTLISMEITPKFTSDGQLVLNGKEPVFGHPRSNGPFRNLVAVQLLNEDEPIGVLMGFNKRGADFDSVDMKLIGAIGNQAGAFLANNRLYADLQDLLMGVLHALSASIDAKDPYTSGHSQRVAMISRHLAEKCNFDADKVQQIYLAGLLHDIGKIGVPEAILCKEGRLTAQEYEDMKRHPVLGANILGGIRQLDDVVVGILSHHERPDGRGYPKGLKGDEIPLEGRIICLADCFDAMSSYRTYRDALPLEKVIDEIRRNSGSQFDSALAETFLSMDLEVFMEEVHKPARTVFPFSVDQESQQ